MVLSLGLAFVALRTGLALRRGRLRRRPGGVAARGRHLRVGKLEVPLVLLGFVLGPLSMWLFRDQRPFGTAHAFLGLTAAALFAAVGALGLALERGRLGRRDAHALAGGLAVLAGAVAAVAGFVLLP